MSSKTCHTNQPKLSDVQELSASRDAVKTPCELMLDLGGKPGSMEDHSPASLISHWSYQKWLWILVFSWGPILGQGLAVHCKYLRHTKLWLVHQVSLSCRQNLSFCWSDQILSVFLTSCPEFPEWMNSQPFSQVNKSKQILRCSTLEITMITGYKKHFPW